MAPDALQAYRLHEAATVKIPYVGLGIALVVLAAAIGSFKLPEDRTCRSTKSAKK